jgi:hypothetical protein
VEIRVYDVAGRSVALITKGEFSPGIHLERWGDLDSGGRPVSPGIYFVKLRVGNETRVARAVRVP